MTDNRLLDALLLKKEMPELDYFLEWGKGGWRNFTDYAISSEMTSNELKDKKVLEIGARYGRDVLSIWASRGGRCWH